MAKAPAVHRLSSCKPSAGSRHLRALQWLRQGAAQGEPRMHAALGCRHSNNEGAVTAATRLQEGHACMYAVCGWLDADVCFMPQARVCILNTSVWHVLQHIGA